MFKEGNSPRKNLFTFQIYDPVSGAIKTTAPFLKRDNFKTKNKNEANKSAWKKIFSKDINWYMYKKT